MKIAKFLQRDSIATQLIKIVFAWYIIVAVLVTITQIVLEYTHTKAQIQQELALEREIFEPLLAKGLWDLDKQQIQSTINGMLTIPIITGVKITQKDQLLTAVGTIIDVDNVKRNFNRLGQVTDLTLNTNSEVFAYKFPINYNFRDQDRLVGHFTLYSNSSAIFDRVEMGIWLLIINSVIKSLALWLLFYYVGKRILLKPLGNLIAAIEAVDLKTVDTFKVELYSKHQNELTLIEAAFAQMLRNLAQSRNRFIELNNELESKVEERTLALNLAKEEAELANQAKSIFMSRINHELRTPLNAIMGCTQILDTMLPGDEFAKQRTMLSHSMDAAEHLLMLFEDIMDVVIMDGGELKIPLHNCDLSEIITASVVMVDTHAKSRNITINVKPTQLIVYCNEGRLKQILINLLTNAIKYNHIDGQIDIEAEATSPNQVTIKVKDTGVGIAEEDFKQIFDSLKRLAYAEEQVIDGSGMGLSIVKYLTERMHGTINVISTVGQGSTFILSLPIGKKDVKVST